MLKLTGNGFVIVVTLLTLSACSTTERSAVAGGTTGAVIGAIATGNVAGAAVGGGIGAVAGALIGQSKRRGYCRYRNSRGHIHEARCR